MTRKMPSADESVVLAHKKLLAKDFTGAEASYRELLHVMPANMDLHAGLMASLFHQGKLRESIDVLAGLIQRADPTGDPQYNAIYLDALFATQNQPTPLKRMLRFYELIQRLRATQSVAGDVVECGCFRGMSSYLICNYLKLEDSGFDGSGYHIFDSFRGLADPAPEDEIPANFENAKNLSAMTRRGAFAASLEHVQRGLAQFTRIAYHEGWIPLTFNGLPERQYRFVHIDVDLYDPTNDCLEYFYPRLAPGGALVSDDYSWPGARKAIDEYCAEKGISFVVTGYSQAVLVKPGR